MCYNAREATRAHTLRQKCTDPQRPSSPGPGDPSACGSLRPWRPPGWRSSAPASSSIHTWGRANQYQRVARPPARTHAQTQAPRPRGRAIPWNCAMPSGDFGSLSHPLSRSGTGAATMNACSASLSLEYVSSCQRPPAPEDAEGAEAKAHANGMQVLPLSACAGVPHQAPSSPMLGSRLTIFVAKCEVSLRSSDMICTGTAYFASVRTE